MLEIDLIEIRKLHGYKNIKLRLKDNTLVLVGENGAGKTTILNLIFYLLSGKWNLMTRYNFESISAKINGKNIEVTRKNLLNSFDFAEKGAFLRQLPPPIRNRFRAAIEGKSDFDMSEIAALCDHYDVPFRYIMSSIEEHDTFTKSNAKQLQELRATLDTQILYLPTYRRIEQELSSIFSDFDEQNFRIRRTRPIDSLKDGSAVELVEFGMKDVEKSIENTLTLLERFAREKLNTMTFEYLRDILTANYDNKNIDKIKEIDELNIDNVLGRIQESILPSTNKKHLREIIEKVRKNSTLDDHSRVICHYFTKLVEFHAELMSRENRMIEFCKTCNNYLTNKKLDYDSENFSLKITQKTTKKSKSNIELRQLSSGEKQIISLFSHLYLSTKNKYFVLIDEPELSLSVPWQKRFLLDVYNADFFSGLIAVTHSPFIYDNDLRNYAHGMGDFSE